MWAAPLILLSLAFGAPVDTRNRFLSDGINRYEAQDFPGALQSFTQALDQATSKRDFARIHLYIGLIQNRYKLGDDAEASFTKALDYDPRVRLPKDTPKGARA